MGSPTKKPTNRKRKKQFQSLSESGSVFGNEIWHSRGSAFCFSSRESYTYFHDRAARSKEHEQEFNRWQEDVYPSNNLYHLSIFYFDRCFISTRTTFDLWKHPWKAVFFSNTLHEILIAWAANTWHDVSLPLFSIILTTFIQGDTKWQKEQIPRPSIRK